jgi:D-alanyl-D-alanine dipeptidase
MLENFFMDEQSWNVMDFFVRFRETPIPKLKEQNWKEIRKMPIEESDEPLVPVDIYPERIINHPEYFIQGLLGSLPVCYSRLGLYERLVKASNMLPKGYKFVILDAWRPVEVQQSLFDTFKGRLKKENPDASDEQLTEMALKFVALPSYDNKKPSPHNTGGSIDLTIANDRGVWLKMGTYFDEMTDRTSTRYYEEKFEKEVNLPEIELEILKNRRLLFHVMTNAGFTNYTDEWWHYDYGNQLWSWHNNGKVTAIYSRTKPTFAWAR